MATMTVGCPSVPTDYCQRSLWTTVLFRYGMPFGIFYLYAALGFFLTMESDQLY